MPTIAQLRYILEVNRTRHFGRAAKGCHVAQPTLSTQIQRAEEELGVVVFDRQRKPIAPTDLGTPIIEQARVVVAAHDELLRMAQGEAGRVAGRFALGVIPTLSPYVLPWFLASFAESYPEVELSIHELTTEEIMERLKRQSLDAAILATPLLEEGLRELPLFFDPFYLYAHPDEAILERGEITPGLLDPTKVWLLADGHCFRTQVVSYCDVAESSAHFGSVTFVAGGFETLRNLIDASGGYTLIPETYARTLPRSVRQTRVLSFAEPTPTREVSLVHHRSAWKLNVIRALHDSVAGGIPRPLRNASDNREVLPVF